MKTLPSQAHPDHLKKQAKELLRLYRNGDPAAVARFIEFLPAAAHRTHDEVLALGLRLHDAQSCLAREYGFASWADLRLYVESRGVQREQQAWIRHWLSLVYAGDVAGNYDAGRPRVAARLLRDHPALPSTDVWVACACGQLDVIAAAAAADPGWIDRADGPLNLPPLVAVTHSRLGHLPEFAERLRDCVRFLLQAGADPNASIGNRYPPASLASPDEAERLSALYGAAGVNRDTVMTEMLLQAGANPDDGESLYHSLEAPDCTRLLLAHGARVGGTNALRRALDMTDPAALELLLAHGGDPNEPVEAGPTTAWGPPLLRAIAVRRSARHIAALLDAGADPRACTPHGISASRLAMQTGQHDVADLLCAAGADDTPSAADEFMAACARADSVEARRIQADHPDLDLPRSLPADQLRLLPDTAAWGSADAVRTMVERGWPVAARGGDWDATALNHAVFRGDAGLTAFLLAHGANWRETHGYGSDVLGTLSWASFNEPEAGQPGDWTGCARALIAAGLPDAQRDPSDPERVLIDGRWMRFVIANPNGLMVDGGGFINTSRATLTTGTPNFAADGSLAGFNVTGGNITVQGAGFNGANIDQVDLLARAVQANAAIYAKNLNVVTGANAVDYNTLAATPVTGSGAVPSVSIDVSNLGGMYANRIVLVGTENGVGVSNKGVLAAQAGDLILTTQGKLVLAGQTNASGNITASAHDGIDNSGTTYAQQSVSTSTSGALTNSGTIAAQQNATISAGSVASTGTLGAGVNGDGTIAGSGDLSVTATGAITATGRNQGGGSTTIHGAGVNLAGSNTSANGALTVSSTGNLNLSNATTTAGGALNASAGGTLTSDGGKLSGSSVQASAANISNVGGQIVSGSTLGLTAGGTLANRQGVIQSAGGATLNAASLDNTGGQILSLNGDGLNLGVTGTLLNGVGGTIGGNGNVQLSAATFTNQGKVNALRDAVLRAWNVTNSGSVTAGGALSATATGALSNVNGTLSGSATTVSGASIDNTNGSIDGDTLAVTSTGNLINRNGRLTQYGSTDQTISAGGTLDSTGGTIASNANSLTVSANTITNDSGTLQQAGAGMLKVKATGALSNVGGKVQTNGALTVAGAKLDNSGGTLSAQQAAQVNADAGVVNRNGTLYGDNGLTVSTQGDVDNTGGSVQTGGDLSVSAGGALSNAQGTLSANGAHGLVVVSAASIDNSKGKLTNAGDGATTLAASSITNTGGTLGGNGDVIVTAQTLENGAGANLVAGGAANLNVSQRVNNAGGTLFGGTAFNLNQANAAVINDGGSILGGLDVSVKVASLSNAGGAVRANQDVAASGAVSGNGNMVAGRDLSLAVNGDYTNSAGNNLHADGNMPVPVSRAAARTVRRQAPSAAGRPGRRRSAARQAASRT